MPFTLAHPAAIIPLHRAAGDRLSLNALVIGSMTPDIAYFVPGVHLSNFSHSLAGLVLFCLPAGMLAYVVFHLLLCRPLAALLPRGLRATVERDADRWPPDRLRAVAVIALSLLIGACTHDAWDSFTHGGTFLTCRDCYLTQRVDIPGGYRVHIYRLIQHASTLAGLAAVVVAALRCPAPKEAGPAGKEGLSRGARHLIAAVLVGVSVAGAFIWWGWTPTRGLEARASECAVAGMVVGAVALVGYCVIWRVVWGRRVG